MEGFDGAIKQLANINTVYFMLAIVLITMVIRRLFERVLFPSLKKQADANQKGVTYATKWARAWNELILYMLPSAVASVAAIIPIPIVIPKDVETLGGRLMVCIVIGALASAGYKLFKKTTGLKLNIDTNGSG